MKPFQANDGNDCRKAAFFIRQQAMAARLGGETAGVQPAGGMRLLAFLLLSAPFLLWLAVRLLSWLTPPRTQQPSIGPQLKFSKARVDMAATISRYR